jgi:hypothetical protein
MPAHQEAFYSIETRRKATQPLFIRSYRTIEDVTAGIENGMNIRYAQSIFRISRSSRAHRKLRLMNDSKRPFRNGFRTYLMQLGIVDIEPEATGGNTGAVPSEVSRNRARRKSGLNEDRSEGQRNDGSHDRVPDSSPSEAPPDKGKGAPSTPKTHKRVKRP